MLMEHTAGAGYGEWGARMGTTEVDMEVANGMRCRIEDLRDGSELGFLRDAMVVAVDVVVHRGCGRGSRECG
jgi:hypothetical protein